MSYPPPTATGPKVIAAGLDLGGTKIEMQLFNADWQTLTKQRIATPDSYPELVAAIAELISQNVAADVPVGIGAAGLIDPQNGKVLAANFCATGHTLPDDINAATNLDVTYINDCRALALSEAVFGAGKGHKTVASVILGTGVGGGVAVNGVLPVGPTGTGGEFGHCAASAAIVAHYGLPVFPCGCGRTGCVETYISGPGLERLALALTGRAMTSHDIATARSTDTAQIWGAWCALTADALRNLILTLDPDVIVLGGGLSNIDGMIDDVLTATKSAQIGDFAIPPIVLAQGGDSSGARGAAWMAAQ